MKDAFISKWVVQEGLGSDPSEEFDLVIIEAFDKVFVTLQGSNMDKPDTVTIDKDGGIWMSAQGFASPDLSKGVYYCGDEIQQVGETTPYETDDTWVWDSVCREPNVRCFGISKESMKEFVKLRKEDIDKHTKSIKKSIIS